eukprot:4099099-Prorocentrum_lima.AAC.1
MYRLIKAHTEKNGLEAELCWTSQTIWVDSKAVARQCRETGDMKMLTKWEEVMKVGWMEIIKEYEEALS